MSSVSRDASVYFPSQHATIRKKRRGIKWDQVVKTIETGEIKPAAEPHQTRFIKEFEYLDKPVSVVVDAEKHEIVTVMWWTKSKD